MSTTARHITTLTLAVCAALSLFAQNETVDYLTRMPLIFSGYKGEAALRSPIGVVNPTTWQQLREVVHPDTAEFSTPFDRDILLRETTMRVRYSYMAAHPDRITFRAWTLPPPPVLSSTTQEIPKDYIVNEIPLTIDDGPNPIMLDDIERINWLHNFDSGVQFSQAYLSPNWYQGGTNSLTLLVNLLWDVKLNEVYHPNYLFTNSLSYKLGLYSTPQDTYHNYGISQDLFQWNLKAGIRARNNWFYSFTAQFKTQFIHNYGENSLERKASFMSPGELNLGIGMTYTKTNKRGNFKVNASISPISYNLKTCIDRKIDPTQFSIPEGKRFYNQIGSNAEITADWKITSNINWQSRIFIFTDYDDFQADWEHTINFSINRFLSTQIYLDMRYDTTSANTDQGWRYWMIKEILSFGFRYAFSTT